LNREIFENRFHKISASSDIISIVLISNEMNYVKNYFSDIITGHGKGGLTGLKKRLRI